MAEVKTETKEQEACTCECEETKAADPCECECEETKAEEKAGHKQSSCCG
ncbi:MAG: hypothetical protein NZ959_10895 [Armatimonadetes bacterium]|nr:hypothetical protein [Armatimonadota bacterium]MDW8122840.1 hypothetical protein [Armatimonadota bacterium]